MASMLPYISRDDLDELEQELRDTKDGYAPDIDAFQRALLLELIVAFRNGGIGVAASPDPAPPHEGEPDAILKRGRYAVGGTYWDVLVLNQDLPDGTPLYAHPAPAQGERDAKDAARYRWLRSKVGMTQTRGSGPAPFVFLNMPQPTYIAPDAAVELDAAIDAAIDAAMSSEGSKKP